MHRNERPHWLISRVLPVLGLLLISTGLYLELDSEIHSPLKISTSCQMIQEEGYAGQDKKLFVRTTFACDIKGKYENQVVQYFADKMYPHGVPLTKLDQVKALERTSFLAESECRSQGVNPTLIFYVTDLSEEATDPPDRVGDRIGVIQLTSEYDPNNPKICELDEFFRKN